MAKVFLRKYSIIFLSVPLYYLCVFLIGGFGQLSIKAGVLMVLQAASLRLLDDTFDYKKDLLANKAVFPFPLLLVFDAACLAGIIVLSLFWQLWYINLLFWAWCFLCNASFFTKGKKLNAIKMSILPLWIYISMFQLSYRLGTQMSWGAYLLTGGAIILSVAFYIFSVRKNLKHTVLYDRNLVGGKAYNLLRIKDVRCPRFFVLDTAFFVRANTAADIKEYIRSELKKKVSAKKLYAVRSSAIDEDSSDNSFAGIMESYLNVNSLVLVDRVLDCYNSACSDRAMQYRQKKGLNEHKLGAVIIQEMVNADYAGVIFTINPINNNPDEMLISAVCGLGDKMVSGETNSSDYVISSGKVTVRNEDILPRKVLWRLYSLALSVESQCHHFQDIEFAVKNNKVYFLQSRDITVYSGIEVHSIKKVLDNANIIESFSGVTLPLTVTFAKEMYYNVYRESLKQGKVPKKLLDNLENTFKNMLDVYEGRIYYNLNSWYKLTGIIPSSKKNTKNMERMMGVGTAMPHKKTKLGLIAAVRFFITFLSRMRKIKKESEEYLYEFNRTTYKYSFCDFEEYNAAELKVFYEKLVSQTLHFYTVPIINDIATMITYGKLVKKLEKYGVKNYDLAAAALVMKQGNVESALSAELLNQIIDIISSNEDIKHNLIELDFASFMSKYSNSEIVQLIDKYLKKYGARVPNELKLETVTMLEDSSIFWELVRQSADFGIAAVRQHGKSLTLNSLGLSRRRQKTLIKLAEKTKFHIRNRERLRLTRTYMFSAARKMFRRFGRIFAEAGIIENEEDIFYLEKDEVFAITDKGLSEDMKATVLERKNQYLNFAGKQTINRIVFFGDKELKVTEGKLEDGGELKGVPSGAGVVEGYVKIADSPRAKDVAGKIVLAKHTDPGWITVFSVCKGLIVERGSILSHSAVVARELGLPAIVGVSGVFKYLKDGDYIRLDAIKGEVTILK